MAEIKPGSERDVQQRAIRWLWKQGWHVTNTSSNRHQARGLRGVPDLICHYHGVTVYIEAKGYGITEVRPSQLKWLEEMEPHFEINRIGFNLVNNENFEGWKSEMEVVKNDSDIRRATPGW